VLRWLSIQGLALVESQELEFGEGLNVLTGETGAGKSLVLGAVGLLLGERADAAWLRAGVARGFVEGTFDLAARSDLLEAVRALGVEGEPDETRIAIRREIHADGRSRALVNGRTILLAPLRAIGEILVDLHGQHEHQQLLRADRQADFFDLWAGTAEPRAALEAERAGLLESRRAILEARSRWESDRENEARLREDAEELKRAKLREGEEDELRRERDRLQHRERVLAGLTEGVEALIDDERGALPSLKRAGRAVGAAAAGDPGLRPALAEAESLLAQASDLAARLDRERDRLLEDPLDLDAVETRLDRIHRLKRKHGTDLAGLLELERQLAERLDALSPEEGALARQETAYAKRVDTFAAALGEWLERRAAAKGKFERDVGARLAKLGFGKAGLRVELEDRDGVRQASADAASGAKRAASSASPGAPIDPPAIPGLHFAFQPNPGEPPRPIQRIASGGELSRVMLAVKSLMAERDRVSVLVFDEVDQGIGGAVAEEVGRLLRTLGERRQVLCITHLPMIAAYGARHFQVTKRAAAGRTTTTVRVLDGEPREEEIARLLAGARASDTTRRQARELLAASGAAPTATPARRRRGAA
jgi:DNA repair protein RecN (Recombination protein N)